MRVLLVKPKPRLGTIRGLQAFQLLEPLELGYLAAALPREHEVRVLDLRLTSFPGFAYRRALQRFQPDVIGLSAYTHEASEVRRLAGVARALRPAARIVVGGHHATVVPESFDLPTFDAVVRGEGCGPFRQIVAAAAKGDGFDGIPQVVVPGRGGEAGPPPVFPDPATLPVPRRDLWDGRHYRSVWAEEGARSWSRLYPQVAMVRSSWGCRMRCTFCVVPFLCAGEHRPRPADAVADEIASLAADHVYFCDDENFIDEGFAWELAEALERRRVRKRYFVWTRGTTVNRSRELLQRWRDIGLDAAFLGFEFTTDGELRDVRKGATVASNEKALDALRSMGIAVHAAFMLMPEYQAADFDRLHEYFRALPPVQCSVTVCTPSPGTPDYALMKPRIWVENPFDLHDAMHPLVPTRLPLREFASRYARLASLGTSRTPRRAQRVITPPLDLARVVLAQRRYYRGFRELYRDYPRELWNGAGTLTSPAGSPDAGAAAP
jgi:radical SAM superfamily enzyme YgiQ (UPF0313 family)